MKNKTLKIIAVLLIAIALVTLTTTIVRAKPEAGAGEGATDDGFQNITAQNPGNSATTISNTAGKILYIVRIIGMAVAVIMLTILGIKYVAASPNEKADYKKGMTVYVIGAVLLFGASLLLGVIQNFVNGT